MSAVKHLIAILLLPGMATIAIPAYIIHSTDSSNLIRPLPFPGILTPLLIGLLLILSGLTLMVKTISLFVRVGIGTLAPWTPTSHLVVQGVYRHVRNPMISGVFCILLGEAAIFGNWRLFLWFGIFVLINMTYMPLSEEPGLEKRFGEEYLTYKKNVPRWVPRRKPWGPPQK